MICTGFALSLMGSAIAANPIWTTIAGGGEVCRLAGGFFNGGEQGFPSGLKPLLVEKNPPTPVLHERLQGVPLVDFDFDNDGVSDEVFWYESDDRYIAGTLFFVRLRPQSLPPIPQLEFEDLVIFSCQFDSNALGPRSCPPLSQEADEAGIKIEPAGLRQKLFFRGRYTRIVPVSYRSKTYLLLRGTSVGADRFAAVIEPTGGTNYKSRCVFQRSR